MRSACILFCVIFASVQVHALTLYVSSTGKDSNNGMAKVQGPGVEGPLATIDGALKALRLQTPVAANVPRRIVLLAGRYPLSKPISLTHAEGGASVDAPTVIEAEKPGTVVLTGSMRFSGANIVERSNRWHINTMAPRGFHAVWINGEQGIRARSPNAGEFYTGAANVVPPVPGDRLFRPKIAANIENTKRLVLPPAAQEELRDILTKQGSLQGLALIAYHSWNTGAQRVSEFDPQTGIAELTPDSFWSLLRFGPDQRYYLENLPAFLDAPSEWWANPDGQLEIVPPAGSKANTAVIEVPQLERLIDINGAEDRPAQHIVLKGLRFSYTAAWTTPFIDSQAALNVPSAVVMRYAKNVSIEDCVFENLGGHAIWVRQGSQNNTVQRNVFRALGAGALKIGEIQVPAFSSDEVRTNTIRNNLIEDNGKNFPGAVGIWIGQSSDNVVAHNELRHLTYSGISVGWTWGFGPSKASGNLVTANYLHDIGKAILSDLGAVYTLGVSPGTVIRLNRIENVTSFKKKGSTAWGIYLDEGSSQILVEQNFINGTTGGGFHLHYGQDNIVRNNVMMNGEIAQARRSRKSDSRLVFERNLLIAGDRPLYEGEWVDPDATTRLNALSTSQPSQLYRKRDLNSLNAEGFEIDSIAVTPESIACQSTECVPPAALKKRLGWAPFNVKSAGIEPTVKLPQVIGPTR